MKQRNYKKTTNQIVTFIQEIFKEKGFKKAIIGISGGLDSAVVATLLVLALGKENVYGESLPCGEQKDIKDADTIAKFLGINYETINIKPVIDSFLDILCYDIEDKISEGNLKARARMMVLYDMSSFHNALVVGTGNRTELELGYFTLYGDGACALEPMGHLYKTEVFELARYLKIPETIINKLPSAGLWEGQTDEDELGYTYKQIDEMLDTIYSYNINEGQGIARTNLYLNIIERIVRNKFKSELPKMIKEE